MAFASRKDFGVRVAGEKAQKPDEFITRSQLIAGSNIAIDYLDSQSFANKWDIRISALTSSGGNDVPRLISGDIDIAMRPTRGMGYNVVGLEDGTGGPSTTKIYYGTAVFADIVHNWNLSDPNDFQYSLQDLTEYANSGAHAHIPHSTPRVVGIDANTVRIYASDTGLLTYSSTYQPNSDTVLQMIDSLPYGDNLQGGGGGTKGYPRFRFTLEEVVS